MSDTSCVLRGVRSLKRRERASLRIKRAFKTEEHLNFNGFGGDGSQRQQSWAIMASHCTLDMEDA